MLLCRGSIAEQDLSRRRLRSGGKIVLRNRAPARWAAVFCAVALASKSARYPPKSPPESVSKRRGALVGESQANGPAAGAGIVAGDVIASLDDQPVKDHRDLVKKISRAAPGTAVKLGVFRKGEHKSVTVTLAETPK